MLLVYAMVKNIRIILTPFLIISYVLGSRIAGLSRNYLKLWFSILYILLVWLIFYFLLSSIPSTLRSSFIKSNYIEYYMCHVEFFITLLSVVFGVYHDKVKK